MKTYKEFILNETLSTTLPSFKNPEEAKRVYEITKDCKPVDLTDNKLTVLEKGKPSPTGWQPNMRIELGKLGGICRLKAIRLPENEIIIKDFQTTDFEEFIDELKKLFDTNEKTTFGLNQKLKN